MVRKLSNLLKKVSKIFRLLEELGSSVWEGIQHGRHHWGWGWGCPPWFGILGVCPPGNHDFKRNISDYIHIFRFFSISKIKWAKYEEKSEFWGGWFWLTWIHPPSQNLSPPPQSKLCGYAPGIRHSGWEFSILILVQLPLWQNFGTMNLLLHPPQWMAFFFSQDWRERLTVWQKGEYLDSFQMFCILAAPGPVT